MGVGGQHHAPATLPSGKIRYSMYRRLGGPQGRSGRVRKILPPIGIRSPDRRIRSESLYRLSYPGSKIISRGKTKYKIKIIGVIMWKTVLICSADKMQMDKQELKKIKSGEGVINR